MVMAKKVVMAGCTIDSLTVVAWFPGMIESHRFNHCHEKALMLYFQRYGSESHNSAYPEGI